MTTAILELGTAQPTNADASGRACPLCTADAAGETAAAPKGSRIDAVVPWVLGLSVAAALALIFEGPERWVALGLTVGLVAGAALAWQALRAHDAAGRSARARDLVALAEDADARVEMVVRQFQWAVNDVVAVRDALANERDARKALEARARERERYVQRQERQLHDYRVKLAELSGALAPGSSELGTIKTLIEADASRSAASDARAHEPISLLWGLHHDGLVRWLELEGGTVDALPSRVRVLDHGGAVVAFSDRMHPLEGESVLDPDAPPALVTVALRASDALAAALESADEVYTFEALVDETWRPVRLEDSGRRTRVIADKQGRVYRVGVEAALVSRSSDAADASDARALASAAAA